MTLRTAAREPGGDRIQNVTLDVQNLAKHFGGVQAVRDVSFSVGKGEVVGLIGPNGSGKTTTFNLICGFIKPDRGVVSLDGNDVTGWRPSRLAKNGIGRTFQLAQVFSSLTVVDNVLLGCPPGLHRHEARDLVGEALDIVALLPLAHERAGKLSYGQRKLLDLATVLVAEPSLVMMDEPVAGVNAKTVAKISDVIRQLHEGRGVSIVLVEHNIPFAMDLCGRLVVLDQGEVIADGAPRAVRDDSRVIEAYLGKPRESGSA